jgi:hypothetical protein
MTEPRLTELDKERKELNDLYANAALLVVRAKNINSDLEKLATKIRHMAITKEAECHEIVETLMKGERQ